MTKDVDVTLTAAVSQSNSAINHQKRGVIWARVSTDGQAETSLQSQVSRCKEKLQQAGYHIDHIFAVHWSSLDLYACPEFQQVQALIRNREMDALAFLDRDRLEAKGLQRLTFLSECKEAMVELVICQGPPILDDLEGQLVEMALAIGKERSVLRARQGSIDGLHDRVVKRRLPSSWHKLYGYQWEYLEENGKQRIRLVPDDGWETVKLIFDMVLAGSGYLPVIQELKRRGQLSPRGKPEWNKTGISTILHNPVYAGRYYGLRKMAVEPKQRRGNTTGNSSSRKVPLEEAHLISEIEIVNPPITWEQREQILVQLVTHQKLAQRNAKQNYLLRGFIECLEHTGQKGEPRKYHGTPKHGSYSYACPVGGCERPYLNGPQLDELAKDMVISVLLKQPEELWAEALNSKTAKATRTELVSELETLRRKCEINLDSQVRLEERVLGGKASEEVAERLREKLRAEQTWLKREETAKLDQLAQLGRQEEAVHVISELRARIATDLVFDHLSSEQWRELFTTLNLRIHPRTKEEMLQFFENLMDYVGTDLSRENAEVFGLNSLYFELRERGSNFSPQAWLDSYEKRKPKELTIADVSIQMAVTLGATALISPPDLLVGSLSKLGKIVLAPPEPG